MDAVVVGLVFEPFLVDDEALRGELDELVRRPHAKQRALLGRDAITDRDDGVEVIVLDVARNLAGTFLSNHPEIPDSCLFAQLAVSKDVSEMLTYRAHVYAEQLGHTPLREP